MENTESQTDALPYRFCMFDGAILVPAVKDGMKGWQCPEDGCPYFEPDPNAPVGEAASAESDRQAVREKYAAVQEQIDAATAPDDIKAALGL